MRGLVLVSGSLLFATFACARVSAELAEPAPVAHEPAPVFVEERPLSCDGTLTAIIGERGVPMEAFEHIYTLKQQKYADRGREIPKTADARYHRSTSERVIYQEVLALEAAKLGVDYDRAALEEREQAQKRGIKDWDQHLRRRGESEESLRALYVAELREKAILESLGVLTVREEEIVAEYERIAPDYDSDQPRIRAAHILIRVDELTSDADALALAEEVYQLAIQPDVDFAELAAERSSGPSGREGGELGIFTADRMVEEFSKAAFAMKPGEISRPVKSKFGYHVIKVYGSWGPGPLPREALEPQIVERLAARKLHQGRRDLKARLLDEYEPINCIQALAESRGLHWPDLKRPERGEDETTD